MPIDKLITRPKLIKHIESNHRFMKITKAAKQLQVTAPALYNYSVEKQCYIKDEDGNFQMVDGLKLNVVDIELINEN